MDTQEAKNTSSHQPSSSNTSESDHKTTDHKIKSDDLDLLLEQYSNSINGKVWRGLHGRGSHERGLHGCGSHERGLHRSGLQNQNSIRQTKNKHVLSTGYKQLDQQLHEGGWPLTTTTELGLSDSGIGELRLLIPALRKLQNSLQNNIIWIAPPLLPFAPALAKEKIDVSRLTIVQTNSIQDTLWAAEQALLAQCCAAVFTWTGNYNLSNRELRRLQLAAEKTSTWNVLFRHSDCLKQASASGLRIHLKSDNYSRLDVQILKQPQGWGGQHCSLSLQPHYENWQRLAVNLLPHHNRPQSPNFSPPINDSVPVDHHQATVTVLTSLARLQTVH